MKSIQLFLIAILTAVVTQVATADVTSPSKRSAARQRGVSYLEYVNKSLAQTPPKPAPLAKSVLESVQVFGRAKFRPIQTWASTEQLQKNFEAVRDIRWLEDASHENFLRRSTWLFPDDGCYARAALAVANLIIWKQPAPDKVFAFGDLTAYTQNTPDGQVTWWYHVAPVVSVKGVRYVLDPAIDAGRPLTLEKWLARMSPYPKQLHVAICGSGSYGPDDVCEYTSDGQENLALEEQAYFLDEEWERLRDLKRDPVQELGDSPPWLGLTGS